MSSKYPLGCDRAADVEGERQEKGHRFEKFDYGFEEFQPFYIYPEELRLLWQFLCYCNISGGGDEDNPFRLVISIMKGPSPQILKVNPWTREICNHWMTFPVDTIVYWACRGRKGTFSVEPFLQNMMKNIRTGNFKLDIEYDWDKLEDSLLIKNMHNDTLDDYENVRDVLEAYSKRYIHGDPVALPRDRYLSYVEALEIGQLDRLQIDSSTQFPSKEPQAVITHCADVPSATITAAPVVGLKSTPPHPTSPSVNIKPAPIPFRQRPFQQQLRPGLLFPDWEASKIAGIVHKASKKVTFADREAQDISTTGGGEEEKEREKEENKHGECKSSPLESVEGRKKHR